MRWTSKESRPIDAAAQKVVDGKSTYTKEVDRLSNLKSLGDRSSPAIASKLVRKIKELRG